MSPVKECRQREPDQGRFADGSVAAVEIRRRDESIHPRVLFPEGPGSDSRPRRNGSGHCDRGNLTSTRFLKKRSLLRVGEPRLLPGGIMPALNFVGLGRTCRSARMFRAERRRGAGRFCRRTAGILCVLRPRNGVGRHVIICVVSLQAHCYSPRPWTKD